MAFKNLKLRDLRIILPLRGFPVSPAGKIVRVIHRNTFIGFLYELPGKPGVLFAPYNGDGLNWRRKQLLELLEKLDKKATKKNPAPA